MNRFDEDGVLSSPEPDAKRRKLRKGTKSCWDCKKRKVKCTFDSQSDTVCIACRRRGASCVGQDQPEEDYVASTDNNRDHLSERLQRVEALLEQVLDVSQRAHRDVAVTAGSVVTAPVVSGYFTPASESQPCDKSAAPSPNTKFSVIGRTEEGLKISEELVKAFPSQADINVFCKSNYTATYYCHQMVTKSRDIPEYDAPKFVNDIARVPDPQTTPPVLIAKRMILFALFIQYYQSQQNTGLSEDPSIMMERLVETAVRLVTTNENIIGCIEGLECIILEGIFQNNAGNLRRAWIAFRKAMVIAQMMKIDCPNPPPVTVLDTNTKVNPKFMWFRIVYMDSYLSLMLGLPHGGQETGMEDDVPGESPTCKLERVHTLIARRIIDRNRRAGDQDFTATRKLDKMLLDVARNLSDRFWLPPNFATLKPNTREAFWEIMRLCDQLHHYNLVHLLHLPYLLRCDKEASYHSYAKITCVTASREILSRCISIHSFNRESMGRFCRTSDFFAFMAGMTILLAHIDSHKYQVEDWRAHQRLGDRAMVEQLLEDIQVTARQTKESFFHKCAHQLEALLQIESDCVRGEGRTAQDTVICLEDHCDGLQLSIPYYGIIKIGRDGITKDQATASSQLHPGLIYASDSIHAANHFINAAGLDDAYPPSNDANHFQSLAAEYSERVTQVAGPSTIMDTPVNQQQLEYPGLAASMNDWALQGVDAAFFDSIMRGSVDWDPTLQVP
ncbi:hypothetical protein FB567DRAFT_284046 [Paraphoma chrysanthemicola]|uniref:Zn(2)-C6 fungal-type domain-containing protein n=1 Tax=Paraphoma chrysanthemicola TaxID=798071 RepID=A0A8K0VR34_9PLEO|nr:hypothetical protein FB567DRAFT_284046 [Paraphoma chrysanthemicola]